jgi:hypothetical protein
MNTSDMTILRKPGAALGRQLRGRGGSALIALLTATPTLGAVAALNSEPC